MILIFSLTGFCKRTFSNQFDSATFSKKKNCFAINHSHVSNAKKVNRCNERVSMLKLMINKTNSKNDNKRTYKNNKRDTYTSRKPQTNKQFENLRDEKKTEPINGNYRRSFWTPRRFDFNYARTSKKLKHIECLMWMFQLEWIWFLKQT